MRAATNKFLAEMLDGHAHLQGHQQVEGNRFMQQKLTAASCNICNIVVKVGIFTNDSSTPEPLSIVYFY